MIKKDLKRAMLSLVVLIACTFILPRFTEAWHLSERNTLSIEEMKLLKGDWEGLYYCRLYGNRKCKNECKNLYRKIEIYTYYNYCTGTPTPLECYGDGLQHLVCTQRICTLPFCIDCGDPWPYANDQFGEGDYCTID